MATLPNINLRRFTLLAVFLCTVITPGLAGPGYWSGNGPAGGTIYRIVADPVVPGVFYAASRSDGIYKSTDNALSWSRSSTGLNGAVNAQTLIHHPTMSQILYVAQGNTLYKTTNGGISWLPVSTLPVTSGNGIYTLSIAPGTPARLFATLWGNNTVYRSDDGGVTWTGLPLGAPDEFVQAWAVDPTNADHLWASTRNDTTYPPVFRFYSSVDGGVSWADHTAALGGCCATDVYDIALDASGTIIYLTGASGQAKSTDGGVTWINIGAYDARSVFINPSDSNEAYLAGTTGVIHTTDGGSTWTVLRANFAANDTAVAISTAGLFSPHDPNLVLVGTETTGVYKKTASMSGFSPSNQGLSATMVRALAVHPSNPDYVLAGTGEFIAPTRPHFISPNGGVNWLSAASGLDAQYLRALVIDPNTSASVGTTVVYATGAKYPTDIDFTGSTRPANGGIYKSTDGGQTWAVIDTGLPIDPPPYGYSWFGIVRDLALDPSSGAGGGSGPLQTLFAVGSGRFSDNGSGSYAKQAARIYKSTNAGGSWTASDTGMDEAELIDGRWVWPHATQIEINPSNPAIMYVATFLGISGTSTPPTLGNGIWKSTDGGASWSLSSNGLPRVAGAGSSYFDVLSLAMDPSNPDTLYASAHDPDTFESEIYKTTDGGANWTPANTGITSTDVRDILVDTDGHIYAAVAGRPGNPGGIYRSTDGGNSWHAISVGLDGGVTALKLTIDESGPNKILYAGTGRSVQNIELLPDADLDGAPDASEATAPNGGDGNGDGTADNTQGQVASVTTSPLAESGSGNTWQTAGISQITIEVTPLNGSCERLENVEALDSTRVPLSPERDFSYGVIRFEIVNCQQAQVRLIYHTATGFGSGWKLSLYAPATPGEDQFTWHDYPTATTTGNQWLFTLADGQFGDVRPANGRILFQGGAGFQDLIFKNGF